MARVRLTAQLRVISSASASPMRASQITRAISTGISSYSRMMAGRCAMPRRCCRSTISQKFAKVGWCIRTSSTSSILAEVTCSTTASLAWSATRRCSACGPCSNSKCMSEVSRARIVRRLAVAFIFRSRTRVVLIVVARARLLAVCRTRLNQHGACPLYRCSLQHPSWGGAESGSAPMPISPHGSGCALPASRS